MQIQQKSRRSKTCGFSWRRGLWRPADLQQREGRILRQGNENKKVKIFRYVTKDTFDAYSWSIIENKQKVRPDAVQ
ncbi:hypothetical protein B6259_07195 [Ruminococcaceae bacterium CPB6]|jgi:SNF2 family DNA or RNA helicase|nr:hypothetical protein [Caproicibacterium lactatifermentans]ARP50676.1 hypothetical protein B6259_07195 [Ruminococcaceae bacterium CPB6]